MLSFILFLFQLLLVPIASTAHTNIYITTRLFFSLKHIHNHETFLSLSLSLSLIHTNMYDVAFFSL